MDALPVLEQNVIPYASKHKGNMHACGHDGHMAMLLKTAQCLHERKTCKYNVLLIFQPAEETTGGAKDIINSGILFRYHVKAIFAFHVWPHLSKGTIATKKGPLMAACAEINVQIHGTSAHIAAADKGKDALSAAVYFLYQMEQWKKHIRKDNDFVLSFGFMQSGSARNVISDQTMIKGTLRALDAALFERIKAQVFTLAKTAEKQTSCNFDITISEGYPPLINDAALFERCRKTLPDLQILHEPNMLSEDFAFYGKAVPSLFFYLGVGNTPSLHSPVFDFDDRVLMRGVETYLSLLNI